MTTISNVQAPKYGSGTTSATVSWDSTPTAGNLLIARSYVLGGTSSGAITGWTQVINVLYGAGNRYVAIYWKIAGASEGDVTCSATSATTTRLVIEEWSSSTGWPSDPFDQSASTATDGTLVTSRSSGTTGTTAVADELAVAVWASGNTVTAISFTNSFTLSFEQPTGSLTFWGAHKVLSSTGTVETTASWTTSRVCGGAIGVFRPNYELTTPAGSVTPSGVPTKETLKTVAGSVAPSGALSTSYIPGGTTYNQSADGSVTPAGSLIKNTLKSLAGSITPAGTLALQTLKAFTGSITPSGVLTAVKMAVSSVSGALTPVGTLLAQALKSLSGSVTPDGELTKQIIKSLSGSITPGGVLTKQTNKNADGSLTPSGVLTTIKAFLRDLSGTLTPTGDVNKNISKSPSGTAPSSGDVDKDVSKSLTGAVTPTGDAAKSTAKSFTGSLTPSGILSSICTFARDVSGSLSPSGDLTVQTQKSPSGQVLPSGALIKQTLKTLAGSTTPSGILTTLFIPGAPAVPGGGVESWGGAFTDDINPRPRRRTVPQTPIDDDEEAILAILLSRLRK